MAFISWLKDMGTNHYMRMFLTVPNDSFTYLKAELKNT
jgi:hypothetical protein